MKRLLLTLTLSSFSLTDLFSQANCSHPLPVTICPSVYLANQTNAGMGDDAPATCNIPGEDVVYELYAPNGARQIYVSITNASAPMHLSLEQTTCISGVCNSQTVAAGNSNISFLVTYANYYYLWVDAGVTVTYNISFGADTATTYISIANTQGNLQWDTSMCATPAFKTNKPFFQVSYNTIFKTSPMTLSPLNVAGAMCITSFFRNTTGIEGVKQFQFTFNPLGFSNVTTSPSIPGKYNAGNWIATHNGNTWTLNFIDSLGLGRGDFTGTPDTCLNYTFCFTLTPLSNNTTYTSVNVVTTSDGFGSGFSGYISRGCCPSNYSCLSGSGYATANAHSFGFSFSDPGNGLPIELVSFTAKVINEKVHLEWLTASETNNDFFTVEKSQHGDDWAIVDKIKGAGNSTTPKGYETDDDKPLAGISFYRLKQTDFDGAYSYSTATRVYYSSGNGVSVYPNPASDYLIIEVKNYTKNVSILITDITGKTVYKNHAAEIPKTEVNIKDFAGGIYLATIQSDDFVEVKKAVVR